ncbi:MAG: 50S ribosomal protein L29 [Flavobacteriales bacterium]|nr:50S ribosomal protein L29 [Flavobacteriales bacterium]MCX7768037.1 50S ribosomal protein L29 [Flavobacteriales bacterium]MDW8409242.1 50S ribosomal protein L29 [Flavobacteriales bacterium]
MKKADIKEMSLQDLRDKAADLKSELITLRFNHKAGSLDNPHKIKHTRRLIAAILTEIRRRELNDQKKSK